MNAPQKNAGSSSSKTFFLLATIAGLGLSAALVNIGAPSGSVPSTTSDLAKAQRLQKVGSVTLKTVQKDRPLATGEEVYKAQCAACHAAGISGAPIFGNADAWGPRLGQGFEALDLTHDELAKEHLRHLVGGRSPLAQDERLLRFEFPERPGALLKFLSLMQPSWNISLFHYRNQGADYGRILVGIQVPPEDTATFDAFLATLGYPYVEETLNPAYRLFLRSK